MQDNIRRIYDIHKDIIISNYLDSLAQSCNKIIHSDIINIYDLLIRTVDADGKIFICGNGGSASTASHFQVDLNNAFSIVRYKRPVFCLTDNISTITAISNDYTYDDVFQRQLQYMLKEKDVLITISGSGNSKNVVKAAEYARKKGNSVVALLGLDGGKLKCIADYVLHVHVDNIQLSEDLHLIVGHLLSKMIRESCDN